jgi:hypothetical protein
MFFDPILITMLTALLVTFDIIILVASIKAFGRNHVLARLSWSCT